MPNEDNDETAPFGLVLAYFGILSRQWLDEDRRPSRENTNDFDDLVEFTQEVTRDVIDFCVNQGIDTPPLLRLLRAIEGRCNWDDVDRQAFLDSQEHAIVRHQRISKDSGERISQINPDNSDVRDLCQLLEKAGPEIKDGERTHIDIAREFTKGNEKKANSLLRQARRFSHLWKADN